MTRQEILVLKLIEECAEVQQRASKLLQFGAGEIEPEQEETNVTRLRLEVNDLLAVIEMLEEARTLLPNTAFELGVHVAAKKLKVERYLEYSRQLGLVEG